MIVKGGGGDMAKAKPRYGHGTGIPSPIDLHVGVRTRMRRTLLGLTQTGLADALGLTIQQVQKYESGINRISSSRLYEMSRVLDEPVEYFFDDLSSEARASSLAADGDKANKPPRYEPDPMIKRETLKLVRAYYNIEDANVRHLAYELIKGLGADRR